MHSPITARTKPKDSPSMLLDKFKVTIQHFRTQSTLEIFERHKVVPLPDTNLLIRDYKRTCEVNDFTDITFLISLWGTTVVNHKSQLTSSDRGKEVSRPVKPLSDCRPQFQKFRILLANEGQSRHILTAAGNGKQLSPS